MSADPTQLERPSWSALTTMSRQWLPFANVSDSCLQALIALMKRGDVVGLFSSKPISAIRDLVVVADKMVEQMVYDGNRAAPITDAHVNLTPADVAEMMHLVELTKPGPFSARTIAPAPTSASVLAGSCSRWPANGCGSMATQKFQRHALIRITAGAVIRLYSLVH